MVQWRRLYPDNAATSLPLDSILCRDSDVYKLPSHLSRMALASLCVSITVFSFSSFSRVYFSSSCHLSTHTVGLLSTSASSLSLSHTHSHPFFCSSLFLFLDDNPISQPLSKLHYCHKYAMEICGRCIIVQYN